MAISQDYNFLPVITSICRITLFTVLASRLQILIIAIRLSNVAVTTKEFISCCILPISSSLIYDRRAISVLLTP